MNRLSEEDKVLIEKLYKEGKSPDYMRKHIESLTKFSRATIYNHIVRAKLNNKDNALTEQQRLGRRKYNVDDSFFDVIDTEEKAYWLGFFFADGYVMSIEDKIGISLGIKDMDHLNLFKAHIKAENPIKEYIQKSAYKENTKYCRIQITSQQLKRGLVDKGVVENKTLITHYPAYDKVPKHLMSHFVRGYFDGDGSFSISTKTVPYNIKICGTHGFLDGILNEVGINRPLYQRYPDRNVDNYYISLASRGDIKLLSDYMYNDAHVYLQRKYDRYLELKSYFEKLSPLD